jgi:hypothetical protein
MSVHEPAHGETNPDPLCTPDPDTTEQFTLAAPEAGESQLPRRGTKVAIVTLAATALVAAGVLAAGLLWVPHQAALGAGRGNTAEPCAPPPAPPAELMQQADQRFAQQLAQALGKPEVEVEQALTRFQQSLPKPALPSGSLQTHVVAPDPTTLAPVAAKLGVTPQELAGAMAAAAPPLPECPTAGQPGPVTVKLDPTQLFAQIAQHLGHGITGEQVQAAFESARPRLATSFRMQSGAVTTGFGPGGNDDPLTTLATALDVTPEQLKTALQSIATSSGCQPPSSATGSAMPGTQNAGFAISAGEPNGLAICITSGPAEAG